ncbi:MAG: nicotinamidase/pyrazinamidase [Thermoanaerobacteraceae bacterium]|nr:nicotinamidase/pyrazinamidase [Thermoanaerobacteraceae bacterium]
MIKTAADARNLRYKVNVYREGVASFDEDAHRFALKEMEKTLGCRIF